MTRIIAALFLIAGLQPRWPRKGNSAGDRGHRPAAEGRTGRIWTRGPERQVQRECISHRRRGVGPAQGRRAQGRSGAAHRAPGGKTLTVLNWSIYYNKQVQKKRLHARAASASRAIGPRQEEGEDAGQQVLAEGVRGRLVRGQGGHDRTISRSFRNSRAPSVASRTACAWCIRRTGNSTESSRAPVKTPRLARGRAQDLRSGGHGHPPVGLRSQRRVRYFSHAAARQGRVVVLPDLVSRHRHPSLRSGAGHLAQRARHQRHHRRRALSIGARARQATAGSLDHAAPVPDAVLRVELLAAHQGQGIRADLPAGPARDRGVAGGVRSVRVRSAARQAAVPHWLRSA